MGSVFHSDSMIYELCRTGDMVGQEKQRKERMRQGEGGRKGKEMEGRKGSEE